jgi:autoinducer 2 (AI-2) kinase
MPRAASADYLLAIDLGSSRVKCIVASNRGRILGQSSADWAPETPTDVAPWGKEYDPARTWQLIAGLVRRALKSARVRASQVTAVGATSQREGIALLDGQGDDLYLGPNTDVRAFFEGQALDDERGADIYIVTGHAPSFLFAPAKLRWFRDNRPELFERIHTVLSLDAWVTHRLCGALSIERAAAGEIGLLDVGSGDYPTNLLSDLGVPRQTLPELVDAGTVIGRVTSAASTATGLAAGTPVVAAGPDTQCGLLGMGAAQCGDVGIVAGWSAPVQMVLDKPEVDEKGRTWSGLHLLPKTWILESSATEAGGAYRWIADMLAVTGTQDPHGTIDRLAGRTPPGAEGVLAFLGPRASDMRDIGPRWGGLLFPVPLTAGPVGRGQLFRATLENLAFALKANVGQLERIADVPVRQIGFGGGLAGGRTLARILANVLERPVRHFRGAEVTALGAAMCTATGAGLFATLKEAVAAMKARSRIVTPDPLLSLEYREHYERWLAVDEGMAPLRDRL